MMHTHVRNSEAFPFLSTQREKRVPRIWQYPARACILPAPLSLKLAILVKGTFWRDMHILLIKMDYT